MNAETQVIPSDQQRIHADQVKAIYQQALMATVPSWLAGLIVLFLPHPVASPTTLYTWFSVFTLCCAWRLLLRWRFNKAELRLDEYPRWGHVYALAIVCTGLVWASALFLLASPEYPQYETLIMVILVGTCIGASHASTTYALVGQAYFIPVMAIMAVYCIYRGEPVFYGLAILITKFTIMLYYIGRNSNRRFFEIQRLRYELAQKKEEAENANIAKSKFLAAASHDLRQPLHALTLFTNALKEKVSAPETRKIVSRIDHSIDALQGLFNALLDISKLDAGSVTVTNEHTPLSRLLKPIESEFRAEASDKGLRLHVDDCDEVVYTDPTLLSRVVRNLVSNAIAYTDSGSVSIEIEAIGRQVVLSVCDTGRGIPTDSQESVFDEFVQLHNPERDRSKGLGLGLAIVRRLTRLLGHELRLDSVPGRGSRFSISLPLGKAEEVAAEPVSMDFATELSGARAIRVVIIDDEASVREGALELLSAWGYRAWAFNDAQSCVRYLAGNALTPDVVLADYRLQDHKTGAEAIDEIERFLGKDVEAAIITGDTAPDRIKEAEASGHVLMHKPLKPMQLRAFLNRIQQAVGLDSGLERLNPQAPTPGS